MAFSKQVLLLAAVAAVACLASLASATTWMVGDDLGWRAKFNQTGWADGKTFVVGDSLMFMYNKEKHTVAQVGKDDFAACNLQGSFFGGVGNSGNDVVTLDKPGKAWFICTVPGHCDGGMKLVIDVVDGTSTTSAPAPLPLPWPFPIPGVPAAPAPFPWPFPFPIPGVPAAPAPSPFFRSPFPWPFPGAPAVEAPAIEAPSPLFRGPFPWPFPGVPAAAPSLSSRSPWWGSAKAKAPSPSSRSPYNWWGGSAPAPAPILPVAAPPSAAVRNPVSGAVAAAVAAVVAAVLAF